MGSTGSAGTGPRDYQIGSTSNRLSGYTQTFTPAGGVGSAQTTSVGYIHYATGSITNGDSYLHYGVDGRVAKAGLNADPANALAVSYTYNVLGQRVFKSDVLQARQSVGAGPGQGNLGARTRRRTASADLGYTSINHLARA